MIRAGSGTSSRPLSLMECVLLNDLSSRLIQWILKDTNSQYQSIISDCREIFAKKTSDYGTAWRILRPSSLTDQIFIKANRIRTLQEEKVSKVGEGIEDEFIGIVNYSIMALIQLEKGYADQSDMDAEEAISQYEEKAKEAFELMKNKNHDYGEAWRDMRVSSLCDLILMKLLRVKQIENNKGQTLISEGIDANYMDILNYAVFALILLLEEESLT